MTGLKIATSHQVKAKQRPMQISVIRDVLITADAQFASLIDIKDSPVRADVRVTLV